MPARKVIHTVGPRGEFPEQLSSCYTTSLDLMKKHNLKTIAFCCVSTGTYGYPNDKAAKLAFNKVVEWMESNPDALNQVIFCTFLPQDLKLYTELMAEYNHMFEVEQPIKVESFAVKEK